MEAKQKQSKVSVVRAVSKAPSNKKSVPAPIELNDSQLKVVAGGPRINNAG